MDSQNTSKTILLHSCCGPCSSASLERLLDEGYHIVLFFSNSNIHTKEEYNKRLIETKKLAKHFNIQIIEDDYNHNKWLESVKGFEEEKEGGKRCERCFFYSFNRSSDIAKNIQINEFATTLTISPYKSSKTIEATGNNFDNYKHMDFKKKDGYKRSIELSKLLNLYRQSYCGCEFSIQKTKND